MAKRLAAFILFLFVIHCGSTPPEDTAEVSQAVTNFGYAIGALQVSHAQPASAFITPTTYPTRGFGGVQAAISRMSNGTVNAPVFYANQGLVHIGTVACNGDQAHDAKAVLTAACHQYATTGIQWTGVAHVWVQFAANGNDITECLSVASGGISGKIDGTEGCSSLAVNAGYTVGIPADGAADLSPQPPDGLDWGHFLTHEILHAAPNNMISTGGVISGLNTFARSHDGTIWCGPGIALSSFNFATCTVFESAANANFLSTYYNNAWAVPATHQDRQNEPWDYKVDTGWFTSANVLVLTPPFARTGLAIGANESTPASGTKEIYVPVHMDHGFTRAIFFEFRSNQWIGGCTNPDGVTPDPPCMTVNAPGVYVWLEDGMVVPPAPGIRGHYYVVQWSKSPSDTTYHHLRPLPLGTDVVLEPGLTARVTGQVATAATLTITAN